MIIDACCTIGGEADAEPTAGELLVLMDNLAVDQAVLHVPDRCYAWDNEPGNALLARAASDHRQRFITTATANPWRPDAWEVLGRAIDAGAAMLSFSPAVQGFVLGDRRLDPLCEKLVEHFPAMPIFIHTGHHSNATPAQLLLLANRFPTLNFIMGHSGSTDYKSDVVPVCSVCSNIYPESSSARPPGFVMIAGQFGWNRAIMGSGFPYNDFEQEWLSVREAVPAAHADALLGGNLARLIGAGDNVC
jgi:hypothetical protein